MVPEGWQTQALGLLVEFLDGRRRPVKAAHRANRKGPYPYYGATGIIDWVDDYLFDEPVILIGEDGENILSRNLRHVFGVDGKIWVNNHAHVVRCLNGVDRHYLCAYLESLDYAPYNTGTAQPKLNKKVCEGIPVLVPPHGEQKKIADILSTWDAAIATTEKLLVNAEAQKRAFMQQLLSGKKRLKGFEGQEWQEDRLSNVATVIVSNVDKKTIPGERAVRLCNYTDVYANDIIVPDMPFMTATATNAQISKFGLNVGDVIITKDSETPDDIAVPAYVAASAPDLVCGYHLAIIRPKKAMTGRFLKLYFEHPVTRHFFATRANGATRFGLTVRSIEEAIIRHPSPAEQERIAECIGVVEIEAARLKEYRGHLQSEKRALMQQLLTGKRRVTV